MTICDTTAVIREGPLDILGGRWLGNFFLYDIFFMSQKLDSRTLITLKNGDSSKVRNLSPAKYYYYKFAKLKSRKNK